LSNPKIIVRILGGLGNQLFCYAAARRLALKSDAELVLDDVSGFSRDLLYQRRYQLDHFRIPCRKATKAERLEPLPRLRRYLKRAINRHRPFELSNYIQQAGVDFDPRLLMLRPKGTLFLEGYWQSESYFKDVEETIRSDLRIIAPTDRNNVNVAKRIRECNGIAMHFRFFDSPKESGANNAPRDYYKRAVAQMNRLFPDCHYFVFSDSPDRARGQIPLSDDRITMVTHNEGDENAYADLWLMTQCRHFIIANSTFSWWGSWLAENVDKQVIVPGLEKRSGKMWWGFEGLLPERWLKL